jgi:hypothetical protein
MSYAGVFGEWLAAAGYSPSEWAALSSKEQKTLRLRWEDGKPASDLRKTEWPKPMGHRRDKF